MSETAQHPTHFEHLGDDRWHDHHGESPPQESHGDTSARFIAFVGIAGMGVLVILILMLVQYFNVITQEEKVVKNELIDVRSDIRSAEAQWQQELSGYAWADPQAGTVSLPIDRAMSTVASQYAVENRTNP